MSEEEEASPLLSAAMKGKFKYHEREDSGESTPLLSNSTATPRYDGDGDGEEEEHHVDSEDSSPAHPTDASPASSLTKKSRRWASFIAMFILAALIVVIIVLAFVVPQAIQEYAQQAAVIEPTNLSLESITTNGVRARVQANFHLDGSRVSSNHVRRVGRAVTWVAAQLESEQTKVDVRIPKYDNVLLGSAIVPPLLINLRDGDVTQFDIVADILPGDPEGIRIIANEWFEGRLDELRLNGQADLSLKSGIFPLGTHAISESIVFEGQSLYRSFASLYFGKKSLF